MDASKGAFKGRYKILKPDTYTTLTVPSTGRSTICTGYHNRKGDTLPTDSGRGYTRDGRVKPTVVVGGTHFLTTGLNNTHIVAGGASMAGAILTGAVALLMEWGIVEKNEVNLYAAKVSTYLIRGTVKKEGIVYPNPEWGYGILSFDELFRNLGRLYGKAVKDSPCHCCENEALENLYFNIPLEIYKRLEV